MIYKLLVGSIMILGMFMGVVGCLKSEEWLFLLGMAFAGIGFALTNKRFFVDSKSLERDAIKRMEEEVEFQYPHKRS